MRSFLKGIGFGLIAGTAIGLTVSPRKAKRVIRKRAGQAVRNVGHFVDDIMG